MMTETAIPTVFQVELADEAEAEPGEEVGDGEAVDFQEVTSGGVGPVDDEITRVTGGVDGTTEVLVGKDEVEVLVCVDEVVDEVEERVEVGLSSGNRTSPRLGKRTLVVVGVAWGIKGAMIEVVVIVGR